MYKAFQQLYFTGFSLFLHYNVTCNASLPSKLNIALHYKYFVYHTIGKCLIPKQKNYSIILHQ